LQLLTAALGPTLPIRSVRLDGGYRGYCGLELRSAGRPARSRGCKSLAMKV